MVLFKIYFYSSLEFIQEYDCKVFPSLSNLRGHVIDNEPINAYNM